MFIDWFEGDCIDVCYHSKTDVRRGVALIEDLRIARFPYVSVGSPQGVESPSGRLCLVCGGHIFPTYACGIDPIAHAEAPAFPRLPRLWRHPDTSAAIANHSFCRSSRPPPPPSPHSHRQPPPNGGPARKALPPGHHWGPLRRVSQAAAGAPSTVGRRLTPGPLLRGSRPLSGLSPLRSQAATEAPASVRSPLPKLLSAQVARAPWIAAPEVEESPNRWVPIGCSLMIGVLSWASTLHAGLTGWRS